MTVAIEMGSTSAGQPATLDLEELLATRLLVQGNSGSGKSHLLRRLIEQSAQYVQQAIIDPEAISSPWPKSTATWWWMRAPIPKPPCSRLPPVCASTASRWC